MVFVKCFVTSTMLADDICFGEPVSQLQILFVATGSCRRSCYIPQRIGEVECCACAGFWHHSRENLRQAVDCEADAYDSSDG